jgi:pimeloyl-ACP methyl ester carboxylesterase
MATFCLIHGAWHDSRCLDPVADALRSRGHEVVTPEMPFHEPGTGFEERAEPAIRALDGADDPVVVGHSMASPYAILTAVARPGSMLIHLCPRLGGLEPPPGAPATFREGIPFPADRHDGTTAWDPETAIEVMYPRLSPEAARSLADRLKPMAPPAGEYPLSAHPDVPTALIYAADDELFEPAWERFMARDLLGVEPIEIAGGHFPMAEDPAGLADLLDRTARGRAETA